MTGVSSTSLKIAQAVPASTGRESSPLDKKGGPSFQEALGSISTPAGSLRPQAPQTNLKFSNHAIDRMRMRGIHFNPEEMIKIESAVGKAQAKGARETLLLTDSSAMIVNIPSKTIVTVMDKNSLKENVFTNIDSTVVI